MDSEICVVCAADERFAMPLAVMLRSGAAHCSRPMRAFVISDGLCDKSKRGIESACAQQGNSMVLHWLDADQEYMRNAPRLAHLSRTTYLRLTVGRLISPEIKRIIYLDSDLLIVKDLLPLWETDLEGNILAAVQDFWTPVKGMPKGLDYCVHAYGIDPMEPLFNAGMLVIDLEEYRRQNVEQECIEFIRRWGKAIYSADQDVLNMVLRERCKLLDWRWNVQVGALEDFSRCIYLDESQKRELDAVDPAILHYSGAMKPWNSGLRSPRCMQYLQSIRDSGWYGRAGFHLWKAKRLAVCVRSAALNRVAGMRGKRNPTPVMAEMKA